VPHDFPGGQLAAGQSDPVAVDLEELAGINFLTFYPFLHTGIIMAA
jgi:hypothetical protein